MAKKENTKIKQSKNTDKTKINSLENIQKDNDFFDDKLDIVDKKLVSNIIKKEKQEKKLKKREQAKQEKERKEKRNKRIKELVKQRKAQEKQTRLEQEATIRDLEKKGKIASWFRLDNAAMIYPSAGSRDWNFVYRIAVTLKERVKPDVLQAALDDIMPRFPSFNVKLCHGFFWNYYERNFNKLKVERETSFPCVPFDLKDSDSFLIRVLYNDYKIILEVFHAISDGRGSMFFFNSLLARYFERNGAIISEYKNCSNYLDYPRAGEMEDSFFTKESKEKTKRPKERPAYKIKGDDLPAGMVNTVEGYMSVSKLKEVAKSYNTNISIFLASVVGYCTYKKQKKFNKPVRISVPVDLRTRFESKTLRNFSSYINVEIKGENLSFEDVISIFKKELENIDNKVLQANINANVRAQKNIFVKLMPLVIKNIVLKACFNYMGENNQTLAFSNIGRLDVPSEFEDYIESYMVNLGRSLHNAKSIGVVSYKDTLNITISSKIYETETERDIFRFLASLGVPIKIYSNRRDLYGTR